jgi:hypothetical protein
MARDTQNGLPPPPAVVTEYARLAQDYDAKWSFYVEATTRETLARLRPRATDRLLDVGCGSGALLHRLAQSPLPGSPTSIQSRDAGSRPPQAATGSRVARRLGRAPPIRGDRVDVVVSACGRNERRSGLRPENQLNYRASANPERRISMKKLFACALLTAAVSLLPTPKASEAGAVAPCADVCYYSDYNTICQNPNGSRTTCWDYLWHWDPPEA